MARIRTIKPEFPQSESMGKVSRDARLLFVQLWTLCDDEGRSRGNSRMLASLLFPYDDDAPTLIDGWLAELEVEGCIVRYQADGSTYIEVRNWLNHQKIDRPSKSKIPSFDESSRILANPRESSSVDQGSRIKDQGSRRVDALPSERERPDPPDAPPSASPPPPPSDPPEKKPPQGSRLPDAWTLPKALGDWALAERPEWSADDVRRVAERFRDHWVAQPGKDGRKSDWQATWRNWVRNEGRVRKPRGSPAPQSKQAALEARNAEVAARWLPPELQNQNGMTLDATE